jgi:outer membrane protein assembly factor BamD (BamD/ComL family)
VSALQELPPASAKSAAAFSLARLVLGVALALCVGVGVYIERRARSAATRQGPAAASAGTHVEDEAALIARAQAALNAGNVALAKAALDEHAQRFQNGRMATQRQLLEAYAERLEPAQRR